MLISMSTLFIYTTVSSLPLYIYIYSCVCVYMLAFFHQLLLIRIVRI